MHYLSSSRKQLNSALFPISEHCRAQADKLRMDGTLPGLVQASLWEDFRSNLPTSGGMAPLAKLLIGMMIRHAADLTEPMEVETGFYLKAHPWISAAKEEFRAMLSKTDESAALQMDIIQAIGRSPKEYLIDLEWTRDPNAVLSFPDFDSLNCSDVYTAALGDMTFCLAGYLCFHAIDTQEAGGAVGIEASQVEARLLVRNSKSNRIVLNIDNLETGDLLAKVIQKKGDI